MRLWQNQRELLAIYFAGISSPGQKCTSYPPPMDFQMEILHIAYCKVAFSDANFAYCKLQIWIFRWKYCKAEMQNITTNLHTQIIQTWILFIQGNYYFSVNLSKRQMTTTQILPKSCINFKFSQTSSSHPRNAFPSKSPICLNKISYFCLLVFSLIWYNAQMCSSYILLSSRLHNLLMYCRLCF